MQLQLLVAIVFIIALQYKCCLAFTVMDDANEDLTASLSPAINYLGRSSQPESRLIPIITFNPFNKHHNQNNPPLNAVTQQQLDQLKKELQALQNAYNKVKPEYANIVKLYKNIQALKAKLAAQGIKISNVVANAKKIKESLPRCPSVAGAKVLGTYCYWVVTAPKHLADARHDCINHGGSLAEPWPNFSTQLYAQLKKAFPAAFATNANLGLWIGIDNLNDPIPPLDPAVIPFVAAFLYLSTNSQVPHSPIPVAGDIHRGVVLTGSVWTAVDAANLHAYVCQSSTLANLPA